MTYDDKHIYRIFTAQHLLKNYLIKTLKDEGIKITPAQTTILFLLEKNDSQTMTDLSLAMGIENSTITGLIDRLEKSGYVQRTDHQSDRRKWSVSITEAGTDEITKARTVIKKINSEIKAGFTSEEMVLLHNILGSFNKKFV